MRVRRARPLLEPAQACALELQRSEREIALLDRVRPLNWTAEQARLRAAFEAGNRPPLAFEYGPRPALSDVRRRLTERVRSLDGADVEQGLLAERALELELEASLAEQVGGASFTALAAQRFPLPEEGAEARKLAERFLRAAPHELPEDSGLLHVTDDARDPNSLWSQISKRLSREPWPVRIEAVPGLVSLAAVASGVVRVRAGARLSAADSRRIALHEVEGHVRPRETAKRLGGIFVAGAARASEDEEGRAILLEERAGLLGVARRRELGRRYLAAESVRDGAELWETVAMLGRTGADVSEALAVACRAHRGGGLARESIYLAGYLRVAEALAARPELERALEAGRLSLRAAEALLVDSVELDDDRDVI